MVLRVPVWAGLFAAVGCLSEAERCEGLRRLAAAQVTLLARGCQSDLECVPLSAACGQPAAVRADADTREVTRVLGRLEDLCGCDAGAGVVRSALCVEGACRPQAAPPPRPALCAEIEAEMRRDLDRQNRCLEAADCAAFRVLTCPPMCDWPTARTADPGRVAALLLEYNGVAGCRDCEPVCAAARPVHCFYGLCAVEVAPPDGCAAIEAEIQALSTRRACAAYADCAWVEGEVPVGGSCGWAMAREAAPRVAQLLRAHATTCCPGCPVTCAPGAVEASRCVAGRCIAARECPRRLSDAGARWTLGWRTDDRTLLVQGDGVATVSPPGVEGNVPAAEIAEIARRADAAAVLCLDDSFHRSVASNREISAAAPPLSAITLRYGDADPRPSGLAELERVLDAVAARLTRGP